MTIIAKVTRNGQVTIPKVFRDQHGITAGSVVQFDQDGNQLIVKIVKPAANKRQQAIANWEKIKERIQQRKHNKTDDEIMKEVITEIKAYRNEKSNH